MKTIFKFSVMGALALSFTLAEEVPPAFETAGGNQSPAAEEYDPFDPLTEAPNLIRVQVEYVEMSHTDLTRLLMEDKPESADATALRRKVQAMVEKDEAQVIDTQVVLGRSGHKSTSESRKESIYPTEYEPPGSEKLKEEMAKNGLPHNPAIPVAFETRNLGSSLESEPTLAVDDKTIDLRILSELVWHTGNTIWHESKDTSGNVFKTAMPEFYVMKINTSITCMSGQYVLAGVLSPKSAEGTPDRDRKVMVFVKCKVLPVMP